jgi:hypothetical protein
MKLHSLNRWVLAIGAACALTTAVSTQAATIISAQTGYWLGSYTGATSSKAQILERLNVLIDGFNDSLITLEAPELPFEYVYQPGFEIPDEFILNASFSTNNMVPQTPVSCGLTLDVTGYEYLHVRIAESSYYYYLNELAGEVSFCNDLDYSEGNDSLPNTISYYNLIGTTCDECKVPEGGTSIALLGLGIAGLGASRRFLVRKA